MSESLSKLTRRQFAKQSVLLTGATAFATTPSRSAIAQEKLPPSKRINLGFIGLGGMGQGHMDWFRKAPDVQVVALCDVEQKRPFSLPESIHARARCDTGLWPVAKLWLLTERVYSDASISAIL